MVFRVGAVRKTVSFDVPSYADIAGTEVEHRGSTEDFCIVVFVRAEETWVCVSVLNYFLLLFLCFLTFR